MENLIEIIAANSLTIRCLPHVVVSHWSYKIGDEEKFLIPYDSNGNIRTNITRTIVFNESWNRKLIIEERIVENGGWWYVKETKNTDSTVRFSRKDDKFFAPTLEEAIKLYLDSKKVN